VSKHSDNDNSSSNASPDSSEFGDFEELVFRKLEQSSRRRRPGKSARLVGWCGLTLSNPC